MTPTADSERDGLLEAFDQGRSNSSPSINEYGRYTYRFLPKDVERIRQAIQQPPSLPPAKPGWKWVQIPATEDAWDGESERKEGDK